MPRDVITPFVPVEKLIPDLELGDIVEFLDLSIFDQLHKLQLSPDDSATEVQPAPVNEWTVYVGEQDGDHYVSALKEPMVIVQRKLSVAAAGRICRINNGLDLTHEPKDAASVVQLAVSLELENTLAIVLGKNSIFEIGFRNSHAFAAYCRYGNDHGMQEDLSNCKLIARNKFDEMMERSYNSDEQQRDNTRPNITNFVSVSELIPDLQRGDIIEFLDFDIGEQLRKFSLSPTDSQTETLHKSVNEWAVYIGEQEQDDALYVSTFSEPTLIIQQELAVAAAGRLCRRNNALDSTHEPKNTTTILAHTVMLQHASKPKRSFKDTQMFATYCRYGITPEIQPRRTGMFDEIDYTAEKWYTFDKIVDVLRIGDIVEFKRTALYNHFGVYVGRMWGGVPTIIDKVQIAGNGTSPSSSAASSTSYTESGIRQLSLEAVADGCLCRINNMDVLNPTSKPPLESIGTALTPLNADQKKRYNVLTENCEHFAPLCRYGVKRSIQERAVYIGEQDGDHYVSTLKSEGTDAGENKTHLFNQVKSKNKANGNRSMSMSFRSFRENYLRPPDEFAE